VRNDFDPIIVGCIDVPAGISPVLGEVEMGEVGARVQRSKVASEAVDK
jgi:hypothetical protein